jgi:hypothetical protein
MWQYLRTFFVCMPLVIWLMLCAAWMRSYVATDSLVFQRVRNSGGVGATFIQTKFESGAGGLGYARRSTSGLGQSEWSMEYWNPHCWSTSKSAAYPDAIGEPFLGFHFERFSYVFRGQVDRWVRLIIPFWSLVTFTSLIPAAQILRALRRRERIAAGICTRCGYDLRATPERCPECGTAVVTSETPSRRA